MFWILRLCERKGPRMVLRTEVSWNASLGNRREPGVGLD